MIGKAKQGRNAFGKAAAKWRIDHNIKMEDMAALLGISVPYLSSLELDYKNLDYTTPMVERLPPELKRVVYQMAIEKRLAECERLQKLITELEPKE